MAIKALMVDVDGVLIDGRPADGQRWSASLHEDLGFTAELLQRRFFAPYWEDIVEGRAPLMEQLSAVLHQIAPDVSATTLVSYWFERDARLATSLLQQLGSLRATGVRVYLATNQEHMRAAYLMKELGLASQLDGIFYSASLGVAKPKAEFFVKVQEAVGLDGAEILLIDDNRQNIEAARSVGWQVLHWTSGSSPAHVRDACI